MTRKRRPLATQECRGESLKHTTQSAVMPLALNSAVKPVLADGLQRSLKASRDPSQHLSDDLVAIHKHCARPRRSHSWVPLHNRIDVPLPIVRPLPRKRCPSGPPRCGLLLPKIPRCEEVVLLDVPACGLFLGACVSNRRCVAHTPWTGGPLCKDPPLGTILVL